MLPPLVLPSAPPAPPGTYGDVTGLTVCKTCDTTKQSGVEGAVNIGICANMTKYPKVAATSANAKISSGSNSWYPFDYAIVTSVVAGTYSSGYGVYYRSFAGQVGEWAMVNIGEPFVMQMVRIWPVSGFLERNPGEFVIYGTNDVSEYNTPTWSSKWQLVHAQTTRLTGWVGGTPKQINITNTGSFSIYVMIVSRIAMDTTDINWVEWELYGLSCPSNGYSLDGYTCQSCLAGLIWDVSSSLCATCIEGTYINSTCIPCCFPINIRPPLNP